MIKKVLISKVKLIFMKITICILIIFLELFFSGVAVPPFSFAAPSTKYPEGTLLREKNDIRVWIIKDRQRKWIESPEIFNSLGCNWNSIILVDQAELDFYQEQKGDTASALPKSFVLDIPFICQAPLGNWAPPFGDACEEAAILTVHYYFQKKPIDAKVAAKEIQDIIEFETKNYNFGKSISAEQTAKLIEDYFGYKAEVKYDISLEEIKKELIKGNPVLVPAAGRMLKNPYFKTPGPLYHMLVIKGYTESEFIVSDPGTKRGTNFKYSYQILEKAIHDWNNGDVKNGRPVMISVQK